MKKFFIWPAMKNVLFSPPKNIINMIYGLVKKTSDICTYLSSGQYYTIIDFNEVDIRIYLSEKVIFTEAVRPR